MHVLDLSGHAAPFLETGIGEITGKKNQENGAAGDQKPAEEAKMVGNVDIMCDFL